MYWWFFAASNGCQYMCFLSEKSITRSISAQFFRVSRFFSVVSCRSSQSLVKVVSK